MKILTQPKEASSLLQAGNIIAYPTEAVYGLGCDPFNWHAVERLLALKHRSISKGLILLISNWQQLDALIEPVSKPLLDKVRATWPGAVTWIFPKAAQVPNWLSADEQTIAVRMSAHPIAKAISEDGPVVSTSANISGEPAVLDYASLTAQFPEGIDAFVEGDLGGLSQPSRIYDVRSGKRLR